MFMCEFRILDDGAMCHRPCLVPKKISTVPSHLFGHMHGALNAVEKITNYTV